MDKKMKMETRTGKKVVTISNNDGTKYVLFDDWIEMTSLFQ